ncbi:class II fructose-1,6-bisphosphate aldolase [Mycoplasmopsis gallinarum]
MALVNAKAMLQDAYKNHYAVPHINTNNLEWTKAILLTAQKNNCPLIIGVSEGAIKYMGGYKTVANLVKNLIEELNITVDIALHLDHGSYEACLKAIDNGFTSVMFDGSKLNFEENLNLTKKLIEICKIKNISLEVEVGSIGGEEDGIIANGELADLSEAKELANLGIDVLAAGIGNIHGPYPTNWNGLNFDKLQELHQNLNIGIVLHGGSGIPYEQVAKAIELGVTKININTELQQANHQAIREFILSNKDLENKNYDPRKLLKPGFDAICKVIEEKIKECQRKK